MKNKTKTPTVVIDASALLNILFPDEEVLEQHQSIFKQFQQNQLQFVAPYLLKLEIANALKSAVRQKRLTKPVALQVFEMFLQLPIDYQTENQLEALKLAIEQNLSVYDAIYAQMAITSQLELISTDRNLVKVVEDFTTT